MKTYLLLENKPTRPLPPVWQSDDVRYADALVAHFLREFTQEHDIVLDPFAGFGTTLLVAESMGRVAYGIEYDASRVQYIQSQVHDPTHVIHGDARQLASYDLPSFDFSMTSPPYMTRSDPTNPLTAYTTAGSGYVTYLHELRSIYAQMAHLMADDAHIIIEVANLKGRDGVTTLAWDIAGVIAEVLHFEGEVIVGWDTYGYGYDHSYCLVFTK